MARPAPPEPWVMHTSRLPASLDADLKRIAQAEQVPVASLERDWLRALVELYDADPIGLVEGLGGDD